MDCLPVLEDLDSSDLLSGTERGPGLPAPGKARGQDGNTNIIAREGTTMIRDANIVIL